MKRLNGKVAIVTGAAQGLGRVTAYAMAKEGASVVAVYNSGEVAAKTVAEDINKSGGKAIAIKVDISQEDHVERMVKETIEKFGRVDILSNIAAYTAVSFKPLHETTVADWAPHLDITLKGSLFCAKAVIPQMLKQKSGRIINMSSMYGKMGAPMLAVYCASKAAVAGYTRAIALELATMGITANCVSAGAINTPAMARAAEVAPEGTINTTPVAAEVAPLVSGLTPFTYNPEVDVPMRRMAEPEEIAAMFVFLASDEARYITGQDISVDGGMRM